MDTVHRTHRIEGIMVLIATLGLNLKCELHKSEVRHLPWKSAAQSFHCRREVWFESNQLVCLWWTQMLVPNVTVLPLFREHMVA